MNWTAASKGAALFQIQPVNVIKGFVDLSLNFCFYFFTKCKNLNFYAKDSDLAEFKLSLNFQTKQVTSEPGSSL